MSGSCFICGFDAEAALEEHHIIPRALDGSDGEENVVTLCANCHKAVSALYGRWFFAEVWHIYEERDHPPDLIKKNPPKGLKYNEKNELVPDHDDEFDAVVKALRMKDSGATKRKIVEKTEISHGKAQTLDKHRHIYEKFADIESPDSELTEFTE